MNKLIDVILKYSTEFKEVLERRSQTSMTFKGNHLALLQAIETEDRQHIEDALTGHYFSTVFKRAIFCLTVDSEIKEYILDVYEEAYYDTL
jgi:hypothetical protein